MTFLEQQVSFTQRNVHLYNFYTFYECFLIKDFSMYFFEHVKQLFYVHALAVVLFVLVLTVKPLHGPLFAVQIVFNF